MNISYIDYSPATNSLDIFFAGCNPPYCDGCCNPELFCFNSGKFWEEYISDLIMYYKVYGSLFDNIFLVGGSPNHQDMKQMKQFLDIIKRFKKKIWLFAREELAGVNKLFFEYCDYIKCGEFIPDLICENNVQYNVKLATSNQKIHKRDLDY